MTTVTQRTERISSALLTGANLLIMAYVAYLLMANIASQRTLRSSAEQRFTHMVEKQAETIGYYLAERQRDVDRLAANLEIQTYYQNKALGMSLQYGLRASLTQIGKVFENLLAERRMTGAPLFTSLRLVAPDGALLVDHDLVLAEGSRVAMDGASLTTTMQGVTAGPQPLIQITAPVYFKSRLAGYVLAAFPPEALLAWVNTEARASSAAWLGLYGGDQLLQSSPATAWPMASRALAAASTRSVCYCSDRIAYLCAVPRTPFRILVAVPAAAVVGTLAPWRLALGVGAVIVAVLFILIGRVQHAQRRRSAEQLAAQQERLAGIIEGTNVGTWEWNIETGETVFNERWAQIAGYALKDLAPTTIQTWMNLAHPDDLKKSEALLRQHFAGELPYYELECRMKHRSGDWLWVHDRGKVTHRSATGAPLRMAGTHSEISNRKRIEEQLAQRTALLSNLLDSIPDLIFFKDVNGVYLGCNIHFAQFVGRPREQVVGFTDNDLFSKEIADFFRENDRIMMAQGAARHNEEWMDYPDGRKVLLDTLKAPLRDAGGGVIGLLGVSRDITERVKAVTALKESEANFRTFFESISDMIFVGTPDGKILFTNSAVSHKLGYSAEELLSLHILDVHPADKRQEAEAIFTAMFRGERATCPLPLASKDGRWVPVETRVWFGKWNGADCIFGISKDLTAEQEAQQRFERLFRNNPALMALSEVPERHFTDINDAFLVALGYSRGEVIGKTADELNLFVHPNQQALVTEQLRNHDRVAGYELQVRCKDGRLLDGLFSGEIINSQGRQFFLTVMIDITKRKSIERQLSQHARIETLMATTSMQFINLKPDETESRIQGVLREVGELIAVDRVYVFAYSPDLAACSNIYEWCAQGIEPQIANLQNVPSSLLPWWTKQMTALRNIRIPAVTDLPPEAGAEREFLESQGIQSLLVVPLSWGGQLEGFIGFDSVQQKKNWTEDDVAPLELLAGIVHNTIKHREAELQLRELNATLERRVDERTRELQAAQATLFLQDKMASVGQLAAGLAHEINNPVSFVATNMATLEENIAYLQELLSGYRELAREGDLATAAPARREKLARLSRREQETALDFIVQDLPKLFAESRDGFRRITTIINSMRTFARKDTADAFSPYDLNRGVEDTLVIARNAYKYNADLNLQLGEIPEVPAVAGQINQVLLNLLVNAAQALAGRPADAVKGVITVRTWQAAAMVVGEIADNGPGIPPGLERQIFDPFFTTKAPGEGTGLGLSISYDIIVNKHQGRLTVRNQPQGGACFRIELPVQRAVPQSAPDGEEPS